MYLAVGKTESHHVQDSSCEVMVRNQHHYPLDGQGGNSEFYICGREWISHHRYNITSFV